LDTIKGRHKVCGDLCRFLFCYGVGRVLITGLKDVFKCAAIFGRGPVSKEFDGERWGRQQGG
jgi:hypothetical protein